MEDFLVAENRDISAMHDAHPEGCSLRTRFGLTRISAIANPGTLRCFAVLPREHAWMAAGCAYHPGGFTHLLLPFYGTVGSSGTAALLFTKRCLSTLRVSSRPWPRVFFSTRYTAVAFCMASAPASSQVSFTLV